MTWANDMWDDAMATAKAMHAVKPMVDEVLDNPLGAAMIIIRLQQRVAELEKKLNV